MANLHKFFINQFNATQTRSLQQLDLRPHEQIKRKFGHKERRSRARRVTNGRSDIIIGQICAWSNRIERTAKDVVEDKIDTRSSAATYIVSDPTAYFYNPMINLQLFGWHFRRRAVDSSHEIVCKFGKQFQDQRSLFRLVSLLTTSTILLWRLLGVLLLPWKLDHHIDSVHVESDSQESSALTVTREAFL